MSELEPAATEDPQDIRPLVGGPVNSRASWLFGGGFVVAVAVLFAALENHRTAITEPAIGVGPEDTGGMIAPAAELVVPPNHEQANSQTLAKFGPPLSVPRATFPLTFNPQPRRQVATQAVPRIAIITPGSLQDRPDRPADRGPAPMPQVIFNSLRTRPAAGSDGTDAGKGDVRVLAGRFANPATTVPKGTVIQAVLETALDSTRAGFARAIVSRDIYGFDGSKILIPKGSRLIGEYKADLRGGTKPGAHPMAATDASRRHHHQSRLAVG